MPTTRTHRRSITRGVAGLALLASLALSACSTTDDTATAASPAPSTTAVPTGDTTEPEDTTPDAVDDATEDELDAADDSTGLGDEELPFDLDPGPEDPDGGGQVELDPVDQGPLVCAGPHAETGDLVVTPDPALLPSGTLASELSITNCGDTAVDWTATTKPWVQLAHDDGNLQPGTTTSLGFHVDADAIEPGSFTFKIKVAEPGANHYVDVQGFRPLFGSDAALDLPLSGGQDAGGCANQCITKAVLVPNMTTPNLSLDVATNTPARLAVFLTTAEVDVDDHGVPDFPGVVPTDHTNDLRTTWTAKLKPLQPATTYSIVVRAIDANGKTSYRVGSFTTITPMELPDGLDSGGKPAGCVVQCITTAIVSSRPGGTSVDLSTHTVVPAAMRAWVSTSAPVWDGNVPRLPGAPLAATTADQYGSDWTTTIGGLTGSTTYHIVVQAIDGAGFASFRVGQFHTAPTPTHDVLVTVHEITVTHDGDSSWKNRGELSFRWAVAPEHLVASRGEDKLSDGARVTFGRNGSQYLVRDVVGALPRVTINAIERDADGKVEFCAAGTGVSSQAHAEGSCDWKINVAVIDGLTLDSLAGEATCAQLGVVANHADTRCVRVESEDHGDDYARFWTVVSFDVSE